MTMLTVLLQRPYAASLCSRPAAPQGRGRAAEPRRRRPCRALQGPLTTIVGWGKWLVFWLGVIGLLICAGQMAIGRRNRHSLRR